MNPMTETDYITYLNGVSVPSDDRKLQALLQSECRIRGFFETMRAEDQVIPLLKWHFRRLVHGAEFSNVPIPSTCTPEDVVHCLDDASSSLEAEKFRVRLMVVPSCGVSRSPSNWLVQIKPYPSHRGLFRLNDELFSRSDPGKRAVSCKLGDRKAYDEARDRALAKGYEDGLMFTTDGRVSETSIANIIWQKGHMYFTPGPDSYPLKGIGLAFLRSITDNTELQIHDGEIDLKGLCRADRVWVINALRGPVQVGSIGSHGLQTDPKGYDRLRTAFFRAFRKS